MRIIGGAESACAAIETLSTATLQYGRCRTRNVNIACKRFLLTSCSLHPHKADHLKLVDLVRFNSHGKDCADEGFRGYHQCSQTHVDEDKSEAKQGNKVEHCCQRVIGARHTRDVLWDELEDNAWMFARSFPSRERRTKFPFNVVLCS